MKGLGTILIIAGIISLALGIYGFITLQSSEMPGQAVDWAIDTFNVFGGGSAISADQSFQLSLVRNRVLLSVLGAAGIVLGALIRKKQHA